MVGMTLPKSAIVRTGSHTKKKGCLGSRAVPRSDAPTPNLPLTLCGRVPLSIPQPPDFVRLEWHMLFVAGVVPSFFVAGGSLLVLFVQFLPSLFLGGEPLPCRRVFPTHSSGAPAKWDTQRSKF